MTITHGTSPARTDEDVLSPGRAVNEVPGFQSSLLTLDHEYALAGDDEEVLLAALAVVHAPLTRGHDLDAEAELCPLLLTFEVDVLPALLASNPRCLTRVEHEPALAVGNEPRLSLHQLCLGDGHGPHGTRLRATGEMTVVRRDAEIAGSASAVTAISGLARAPEAGNSPD